MTAAEIVQKYIAFFERKNHKRILNSPLVPQNDPTTLFTSSGMQPLVPYLLGEAHEQGNRLVNVQNCFRAQDIDEIGDNRHTTFFRMLGNWSLGDPASPDGGQGGYFKKEQLPWFFEFLTKELELDPKRLYVTVFKGDKNIPKDDESAGIWSDLFEKSGINPTGRIFYYGTDENWWSRAGEPDNMPNGEPGGTDSEVFFDFYPDDKFAEDLKIYSHNGRLLEIGNSVFMQFIKKQDGTFEQLPKKNVDFGGGLERILAAVENQQDVFQTSLFAPMIRIIETQTKKNYKDNQHAMRIIADHFVGASFMASSNIVPSNKEQGYIMRRLIRRGLDNYYALGGKDVSPVIENVVEQYKDTDPDLITNFEKIKNVLLEEEQKYKRATTEAKKFIEKKYGSDHSELVSESRSQTKEIADQVRNDKIRVGDELKGVAEISADDAFVLYTTHGLSPTQIKSLGYVFKDQEFAEKMKAHQDLSRTGAGQKFRGGLADHEEKTIMGHTATHLLHQALRDVLGKSVHQTGSNITTERLRFDFNYDKKLTDEEIKKVEEIINEKIKENLPVHFEMMTPEKADELGAIGLFRDTYGDKVKIYFIGPSSQNSSGQAYSIEYCGGPHVDFTGVLKKVTIIKQENIGHGQKRLYATVNI